MGPSVEHILALEVNFRATAELGQRLGVIEARGSAGIFNQHVRVGFLKSGIAPGLVIGLGQVEQWRH